MAEMWYYTCEGKQMDPVSIKELKRLVGEGMLKPTDMIWREGMPRWIRASSQKELFPDPAASLDQYFSNPRESSAGAAAGPANAPPAPVATKKSGPARADEEDEPRPQKRRRRSADDDDDRPRRRAAAKSNGSSAGIVIAMILCGLVLVGALVGGMVILIVATRPQPMQPPMAVIQARPPVEGKEAANPNPDANAFINGVLTYQTPPIGFNGKDSRTVALRQGIFYDFTVRSNQAVAQFNLFIIDRNGKTLAKNIQLKQNVRLQVAENGDYRVEVVRTNGGFNVPATVTITETLQANVGNEAPPADVKTGRGSWTIPTKLLPGQEHFVKFRVKAGHPATIRVSPFPFNNNVDVNLFVTKDSDNAPIVADEAPTPDAKVEFNLQATEVVRVRIHNASKTATVTRFTLFFDVGN